MGYVPGIAATITALFLVRRLVRWVKSTSHVYPYPPGPNGLPIIGNVFDMPAEEEWETVRQWGEKYGKLYQSEYLENPHLKLMPFRRPRFC